MDDDARKDPRTKPEDYQHLPGTWWGAAKGYIADALWRLEALEDGDPPRAKLLALSRFAGDAWRDQAVAVPDPALYARLRREVAVGKYLKGRIVTKGPDWVKTLVSFEPDKGLD